MKECSHTCSNIHTLREKGKLDNILITKTRTVDPIAKTVLGQLNSALLRCLILFWNVLSFSYTSSLTVHAEIHVH